MHESILNILGEADFLLKFHQQHYLKYLNQLTNSLDF